MRFISLVRNETVRLLHSRVLLVFMMLIILAMPFCLTPAYNIIFVSNILSHNTATNAIFAPVRTAALMGAILFAVFTVFELDRIKRHHIDDIVMPSVGIMPLYLAKTISFIMAALFCTLSAAIIWLPYSIARLSTLFDLKIYLFSFFMILFPAMLFSILFAAGLYMLSYSMEISMIFYAALFYAGIFMKKYSYLAPWVTTDVNVYSSCFGNAWVYRTVLYNRLLWLLISLSVFIVGVCCVRRYNKGIFFSFIINSRRFYRPVLAALLITASFYTYAAEPYCDNSDDLIPENQLHEMNKNVSTENISLAISLDTKHGCLNAATQYKMTNQSKTEQKLMMKLHPGYAIKSITANGKPVKYKELFQSRNHKFYNLTLPGSSSINLEMKYAGKLKIWKTYQWFLNNHDISKDYVCLTGDSVFPMLDAKGHKKITATVILPSNLSVIGGTSAAKLVSNNIYNGTSTWNLESIHSLQINAGDYISKKILAGNQLIDFYYSAKQEENVKNTGIIKIIENTANYYNENLGQLFPDQLAVVENSATTQGGWMMYGLSCFDEDTLDPNGGLMGTEGHNDGKNIRTTGAEILTHEMGHQWWYQCAIDGNSWSDECLTVYLSYKFLQHENGEDFVKTRFEDVWKTNVNSLQRSYYYRNPNALNQLKKLNKRGVEEVGDTISSTLMYDVLPLQMRKAETLIGSEKFMKVLGKLYDDSVNKDTVITYQSFLKECDLTEKDLEIPGIVDND